MSPAGKFVCIRDRRNVASVTFPLVLFLVVIVLLSISVDRVRGDATNSARRSTSTKVVKADCGSEDQIAARVGRCMDPIFDIVEGRYPEAKSDEDLVSACNRFANTEKCVRQIAKDCLLGIQRTSTSAVATATKRFRVNECKSPATRARYVESLSCCAKKGKEMMNLFQKNTGIAQAIRDLPNVSPEEKVLKMCCLLTAIDREIEEKFNADCPNATKPTLDIVHAMSDDARSTLCVNPKCNNWMDANLKKAKYKPPQNLIEPIMQVLFMLGSQE